MGELGLSRGHRCHSELLGGWFRGSRLFSIRHTQCRCAVASGASRCPFESRSSAQKAQRCRDLEFFCSSLVEVM